MYRGESKRRGTTKQSKETDLPIDEEVIDKEIEALVEESV